MHYDYLVVGSGLFAATFVNKMREAGKTCYMIEKRDHIGGNIYTEEVNGINVHKYGAHIFHTSDKEVWNYVNQFAEFNNFVNSPVARYKDEIYNLPFNMNTFSKMWNVKTPDEAMNIIEEQKKEMEGKEPSNLEEQAISLVGRDVYTKLIKGYTEKQWGKDCKELPAFIIKRLPLRFTYNNNYFNDKYQGIPEGGYTQIIEKMIGDTEVAINVEYKDFIKENHDITYDKVLYTGPLDEYYDYKLGQLEYRSLRFETELIENCLNYQGNAVVNYTEREIPYTRVIEHKHFEFGTQTDTVVTKEYPADWKPGDEPYYPINNDRNNELYARYAELASQESDIIFGGRLGLYKYFDMDKIIAEAIKLAESEN